jgi:uncharacterized protein YjiS (DUF1127 family)
MAQVISNLGSARRNSTIGEGLVGLFNRVSEWSDRRRARSHLYQMPDYILSDIGVSRSEVDAEYGKPFWKA